MDTQRWPDPCRQTGLCPFIIEFYKGLRGAVAGSSETAGKSWSEFFIESSIRVLGFSTIGFVLLIFFFLLREGLPVLWEVSPGNLFGTRWYPTFDIFGTLPLILGSAYVTIAAIADSPSPRSDNRCFCPGSRSRTGPAKF